MNKKTYALILGFLVGLIVMEVARRSKTNKDGRRYIGAEDYRDMPTGNAASLPSNPQPPIRTNIND